MGTLRSPTGEVVEVPDDQVESATATGYTPISLGEAGATTGAITPEDRGTSGVIGAGASSTLSGITLGLSDVALKQLLTKSQFGRIASDRAQHPTLSATGQFVGALAPAVLSGGAATPAGLTSSLGRRIVEHAAGEGAGLAARVAAHTAGAAAEGALYGGGDYLSQVALEDKPLSAEGFIGGMGHGALFAAPVGGALTLGGEALLKARSLFPRSEVSAAAASGIQQDATSTLARSVSDGDAMAAAAERKIQLLDAKVGQAQAGENVTRRVFGQADPAALGDQVAGGAEKSQIVDAVHKYQASKAQLADWVASEADPELEKAMSGLLTPEVQAPGADHPLPELGGPLPSVPVGEFGAPGAGGMKSSQQLAEAAAEASGPEAAQAAQLSDVTRAGKQASGFAEGTPVGFEPAAAPAAASPSGDLEALLRGTQEKLAAGEGLSEMGAPARREYVAAKATKTSEAADHFRAKANAENFARSEMGAAERAAQPEIPALGRDATATDDMIGAALKRHGIEQPPGGISDLNALLGATGRPGVPVSAAEFSSRASLGKRILNQEGDPIAARIKGNNPARMMRPGDVGPSVARAAKVIGDHEDALAGLVDAVGTDAPASAIANAKALRAARAGQDAASSASTAKTVADLQTKMPPAATGALGKAADVGTALEVLRAMGAHVPGLGAIPVIGPVLSLFLKARAVMGILGRKGGSIGRTTEGLVASKAAATRDRINAATRSLLTVTGRGATKAASFAAGPSALLATKLFPGGKNPKSDDPHELYAARLDEITRAQQPGAIDHAISDRYQTSDPHLHDAIVAQTAKGIAFLDSKAPKQTTMPGMLPGDGNWRPSKAALDTFGRYVHAVNDPASVLEDLAKGHVTLEGAETLRTVYPALFAEAQRTLLEAAPEMHATLPYTRQLMISIMYQIPLDATMTPSHAQYLKTASADHSAGPGGPQPQGAPPGAPAIAGPLRTAPQTMTALDRRAGA